MQSKIRPLKNCLWTFCGKNMVAQANIIVHRSTRSLHRGLRYAYVQKSFLESIDRLHNYEYKLKTHSAKRILVSTCRNWGACVYFWLINALDIYLFTNMIESLHLSTFTKKKSRYLSIILTLKLNLHLHLKSF